MKLSELDVQDLFTGMIIGEAAGEDFVGKLAVACAVRNRVNDSRRWSNDYKAVILQAKQFSCLNSINRTMEIAPYFLYRYFKHFWSEAWWRECWSAAFLVLYDWVGDITNGANHYHVEVKTEVSTTGRIHEFKLPYWAEEKIPVFKWGGHWFYKL